ncbi:MAG TPA: hypothetical protein EYN69_07565 [Flavobacteriales bacterium]|nr:hypothetical protein [Flavobacteriales bacterium]
MQSKTGRHRATHNLVNILDEQGRVVEHRGINRKIANFIFRHFEQRGDTESFSIYINDLDRGHYNEQRKRHIEPDEVRHQLTDSERSFTSNGAKLWYHKPIFVRFDLVDGKFAVPATASNFFQRGRYQLSFSGGFGVGSRSNFGPMHAMDEE